MTRKTFVSLGSASLFFALQGCFVQPGIVAKDGSGGKNSTNPGQHSLIVYPLLVPLPEGAEIQIHDGVVEMSNIPRGRAYSFAIREDGKTPSQIQCSGLAGRGKADSGGIHIFFGASLSDKTETFHCWTSNQVFDLKIATKASPTEVLGNSLELGSNNLPEAPLDWFTDDGRLALYNFAGSRSSSGAWVQDLRTGAQYEISRGASDVANVELKDLRAMSLSPDGRFAAFVGEEQTADFIRYHYFVRDLRDPSAAPRLLSTVAGRALDITVNGGVSFSQNGRYLVFQGRVRVNPSNTLLSQDPWRIYVADLDDESKALVTAVEIPVQNSLSDAPQISNDGRYLLYGEVLLDARQYTVAIRRRDLLSPSTILVTTLDGTTPVAGYHRGQEMSADGRYVVFFSVAPDLYGGTSAALTYTYFKDLGAAAPSALERFEIKYKNKPLQLCTYPSVSNNGRFVVCRGREKSAAGDQQVFLIDRSQSPAKISVVSATDGTESGQGNGASFRARISRDQSHVLFYSSASNLTRASMRAQVLSKSLANLSLKAEVVLPATVAYEGNYPEYEPRITPDGRYVVFSSMATNLVGGLADFNKQIFRKDLANPSAPLVLVSSRDGTAPTAGNLSSSEPQISDDGRYVEFSSLAMTLTSPSLSPGTYLIKKDLQNLQSPAVEIAARTLPVGALESTAAKRRLVQLTGTNESLRPWGVSKSFWVIQLFP